MAGSVRQTAENLPSGHDPSPGVELDARRSREGGAGARLEALALSGEPDTPAKDRATSLVTRSA
jgi:hypothetical protein